MKTYEELLTLGEDEVAKGKFCSEAVQMFRQDQLYLDAQIADKYYNKHNVTIEQYTKWLYTVTGRQVEDIYSADHRLKTHFFRRNIIQQANYLLGKGVQLDDPEKKKKLGKNFDYQLIKAAKIAMVEGRAFGFWNADHLEVFGFCCTDTHAGFCPVYSEETAELMAGIRFHYKTVGKKTIVHYTLFEKEGITRFLKNGTKDIEIIESRKPYFSTVIKTNAEGVVDVIEDGYGELPIVPLYASDTYQSELNGVRESIDCYDLVKSGLANNIDDASEIFWLVNNAGGMDDVDLAQFLQRLKRTHSASVDSSDGGGVTAHTIDIPVEARQKMLEIIRTDLYDDMMLIDRRSLSAAQKTAQELDMAYQPQDDKANDFEFFVMEFMDKILRLAGIDSEITLTRNKVTNTTEHVNMILSSANFISPECVIRHLSFLTPEEQDEEIAKMEKESFERFYKNEEEQSKEDSNGEANAGE